jgi:hypothetical protein
MLPELYCGGGARVAARLRARELLSGRLEAHPDFLSVESDAKWLGIGEIRDLILWARYAPVVGRYRVALLGPAERLTAEAANALLKLLEEVPPYLAVILYAEAPDRVIPTVRSRSTLRFAPSPLGAWREALQRAGYDAKETEFILSLCEERPEEIENFLEPKRDVFLELEEAKREAEGLSLSELFLRFSGEATDPLRRRALSEVIFGKLLGASSFQILRAAEVLSKTGAIRDFLWELLRILREKLEKEDPSHPLWQSWARKISLARGEIEANANLRLLAEVVLLWPRKG